MAEEVQVIARGPLFDGRAAIESEVFLQEAITMVAIAAKTEVDRNLAASIRHPSSPPHYQAAINIATHDLNKVINDGGVIYSAWLEGVGSRNKTTRFKGYASFRRAKQAIEQRIPALVEPALARLLGRL